MCPFYSPSPPIGGALVALIEHQGDTEATRKLALQTLELLTIENASFVCNTVKKTHLFIDINYLLIINNIS